MFDMGINSGMFGLQLINLLIIVGLVVLPVAMLILLFRNRPESDLVLALWVLIILIIPGLGSVAYLLSRIIRPVSAAAQVKKKGKRAP